VALSLKELMMLTKLEEMKLSMLRKSFGNLSLNEALSLAIGDDDIKRELGPFDQATAHFVHTSNRLLDMACLLEKELIK
jgi:hypothetical protein